MARPGGYEGRKEFEMATMAKKIKSLMQRLLEAGYPCEDMDHHESDLYVYVTPLTTKVIEQWCWENRFDKEWQCPTFCDQITGRLMYDCAFQYIDSMDTAAGHKRLLAMLKNDGYLDALDYINSLESKIRALKQGNENAINREQEFLYLKNYVKESNFGEDICQEQMRCLWTTYCLHNNLTVDTIDYDNDLLSVWETAEGIGNRSTFCTYDDFDDFMCSYLV